MDWRYNTIWFDDIDPAKIADIDLRKAKLTGIQGKEYVRLRGYRQKNGILDEFPMSPAIAYLEFNFSGIKAFTGLDRIPGIRRLETQYCYKLESDAGLEAASKTLHRLFINQSKKFRFGEELLALKELRVLALNECGEIDNLEFLHEFPKLISFLFVNTNVKSGDLSPILKHNTIRTVGFLNKRHYNLSDEEIDRELATKSKAPYKEFISKGQWQTFRYIP